MIFISFIKTFNQNYKQFFSSQFFFSIKKTAFKQFSKLIYFFLSHQNCEQYFLNFSELLFKTSQKKKKKIIFFIVNFLTFLTRSIMQTSFMLNHPAYDSDDSSSSETQKIILPSIFSMMENRGVYLDPSQMSPFAVPYGLPQEVKPTQPVYDLQHQQQILFTQQSYITNTNAIQATAQNTIEIPTTVPSHAPRKRKESKRTLFSEKQRSILMHWLRSHQSNPYPTSIEKQELMEKTGLNRDQINVWFTNNRVRHGLSTSSQHHGHSSKYASLFKQ